MVKSGGGFIPPTDGTPGGQRPGDGDCWRHIGVSGDRTCPELTTYVHCRNCPVFATAARDFFDRPAPEGYLGLWSRWLADTVGQSSGEEQEGTVENEREGRDERASVLIFRLAAEWLAFRTRAVAEVTTPRPIHRVPHRTDDVFLGLVNLQGQVQLCVSLQGLLGVTALSAPSRLVVLRDRNRAENWAFAVDEVLGVERMARGQWRSVPATLANPAVAFSQAVFSWKERSVGLLDEERVFTALRSLQT